MTDSDPIAITASVPKWALVAFASMLGLGGAAGAFGLVRTGDLATKDEVRTLLADLPTTEATAATYMPRLDALDKQVTTNTGTIRVLVTSTTAMQESIWAGRAEVLARECEAKTRNAERGRRVRTLVYERALDNLHRGNPIHAGLDEYLR